jgi:hypothetical protein
MENLENRVTPSSYLVNLGGDSSGLVIGSGSGNSGDLRYCLNKAIADQQADTITFASNVSGTISLDHTLTTAPAGFTNFYGQTAFVIGASDNITIDGPGVTIDGGDNTRLFVVEGGGTLQLNNLTLSGGSATGGAGGAAHEGGAGGGAGGLGGAVLVRDSTFTANGCTFQNNKVAGGAGGSTSSSSPGVFTGAGGGGMGGAGQDAGTQPANGGFGNGGGGGGVPTGGRTGFGTGAGGAPSGGRASHYFGGAGGFGGGGGGAASGTGGAGGFGGGGGGAGDFPPPGHAPVGPGGFGAGAGGSGGSRQNSSAGGGAGGGGGAGLGGAVFSTGGTVTLTHDVFSTNSAQGGAGGSVQRQFNGSPQHADGKPGQGLGGAVFVVEGTLNETFITFQNNTVTNGDGSGGDPNAADVFYPHFAVTPSTASQPITQTTLTITGVGFLPAAAYDSVTFNDGAAGTVTLASANSLTVTFTTQPTVAGSLTAVVNAFGGPLSGSPVQVATVTPVVTPNSADLAPNAPQITINGFGFDSNPASNTVTFNDGAVGNVTTATNTSLTVQFSTLPTPGILTAIVTTDGLSSGAPVQVGTVPAHDTYMVNVTGDTGTTDAGVASNDGNPFHGDLRYCLNQALTDAQNNIPTITFDPTVFTSATVDTITLSSSLTTKPSKFTNPYGQTAFIIGPTFYFITIDGSLGANTPGITVDGNAGTRLFAVEGGATLQVQNLTLMGGSATGGAGGASATGDGGGGAAGLGGAVLVDSSTFTASGCTFLNNKATGGAGGASTGTGTGFIHTGGGGGGLAGPGADATAHRGGNGGGLNFGLGGFPFGSHGGGGNGRFGGGGGGGAVATGIPGGGPGGEGGFGGGGGGIGGHGGFGGGAGGGTFGAPGFGGGDHLFNGYNNGGGGGAGLGGAIFSTGGTLTLTNDTFTQNTATGGAGGTSSSIDHGGAGQGDGGAVFMRNGTLTATFDTFSGNTFDTASDLYVLSDGQSGSGFGSGFSGGTATANIVDSILGQNGTTTVTDFYANAINSAAAPDLTGSSNNLVSDNPASPNGLSGTVAATDPGLDSAGLADNGGPTQTIALVSGSPAIAAGTPTSVTVDQRGLPRKATPDIGAFEVQTVTMSTSTAVTTSSTSPTYGDSVTFTATVTATSTPAGSVNFVIDSGTPVAGTVGSTTGTTATWTYSTSTLAAGTHTVEALFVGTGTVGDSTGTLSAGQMVNKANAKVVVTPYTVPYDGNAHTATYTITGVNNESGATVGTVDVSNTTHTNANPAGYSDSWSFAGTANYNDIASTPITDVINLAGSSVVVTINGGPFSYTGLAQTPATVAVTGAGGLNLAPAAVYINNVNAGTATASYTYAGDANHTGSTGSATFTINRANAKVVVTPYTVPYDGNAHTATYTITGVNNESDANVGSVDVSNTTHTNANPAGYSDSWSFTGTGNYNDIASTPITDIINLAPSSVLVTINGGPFSYTGLAQTPATVAVTGAGGLNLAPAAVYINNVNAGTATASYTYAGDANHTGSAGSATFTINKANAKISVTPYSVTYDGKAHTATYTITGVNGESGATVGSVDVSNTTHTNPGVYSDTWTFTDPKGNYQSAGGVVTDTIKPMLISGVVFADAKGGQTPLDGVQEPGEPGITNVPMQLLNSSGAVVATTTTDTNGDYQFALTGAGTYTIVEGTPGPVGGVSYIHVTEVPGSTGGMIGDHQIQSAVPLGQNSTGNNFTEFLPYDGNTGASRISSNFNGTAIAQNNYVWFSSVLKVGGLSQATTTTVLFVNQHIDFTAAGTSYHLPVPNSRLTFDPAATASTATVTFSITRNEWEITVPTSTSGNTLLSGLAFPVPAGGLPGGINPVTWSGNLIDTAPNLSVNWQWAAAVYKSFSSDNNALGVKPLDVATAQYPNSDHAGTPEAYRSSVTGGAGGGGGSNFTGGYSGTQKVTPTDPPIGSVQHDIVTVVPLAAVPPSGEFGTFKVATKTGSRARHRARRHAVIAPPEGRQPVRVLTGGDGHPGPAGSALHDVALEQLLSSGRRSGRRPQN